MKCSNTSTESFEMSFIGLSPTLKRARCKHISSSSSNVEKCLASLNQTLVTLRVYWVNISGPWTDQSGMKDVIQGKTERRRACRENWSALCVCVGGAFSNNGCLDETG